MYSHFILVRRRDDAHERRRDHFADGVRSILLSHYISVRSFRTARTFIFAGHDTTAAAVGWLLYELSAHPADQIKIREEILRTSALSLGEYNSMPLLNAAIKVLHCHSHHASNAHPPLARNPFVGIHSCTPSDAWQRRTMSYRFSILSRRGRER